MAATCMLTVLSPTVLLLLLWPQNLHYSAERTDPLGPRGGVCVCVRALVLACHLDSLFSLGGRLPCCKESFPL